MATKQAKRLSLPVTPFNTKSDPALATIQFCPGIELGRTIDHFVEVHEEKVYKTNYASKISRGEAAKRLAILGVSGFDVDLHYVILAKLAGRVGGREPFQKVCLGMYQTINAFADQMGKPLSQAMITFVLGGSLKATEKQKDIQITIEDLEKADELVGAKVKV